MHNYSVELSVRAARPLTLRALFAVAGGGGAAVGRAGERELDTTLKVRVVIVTEAKARGAMRILNITPGEVLAAEALAIGEFDRRESGQV